MPSWRYFPVVAGDKQPALEGDWRSHATDDEAQIAAWEDAGYNLALDCEASGVVVVDLDGGDIGRNTWAKLCAEHGIEPTYTVLTPRGGEHQYFEGEAATSVQKLGPKVDTRGAGGYVLIPGSTTADGAYSVLHDRPLAKLPAWVPARLNMARERREAVAVVLDQPANIQRAVAWLQGRPEVVQGDGADSKTFEAACRLRDFGLSQDTIIDTMLAHYRCSPRDERFEAFITRKVENAHEYAQNEAGAWGVTPGSDTFAAYLESLPPSAAGGDQPDPYHAYSEEEQDAFKEPSWIARDLIPNDSVVMLLGPPGSYKSFLALDIGMTIAAGVPGWELPAQDPQPVVYVAGEGPRSIGRLRRPAWRIARNVAAGVPFHLVTKMPYASQADTVAAFVGSIKAQGLHPRLVVIDTLARFMLGLNENDARDCGVAVNALEFIRRELRCSVLVIHHTGKDADRGSRGSNALVGGIETLHEVQAHKETRAVAIVNRRQKDGEERAAPWLFEGKGVGNSLVFFPITAETHRALTKASDELGPKAIGAVLARLGARGRDHAVTTHALASSLYQGPQEEAPELTQANVDRMVRQLRAAARGRLEPYAEREGRELLWMLPDA